MLPPLALPRAKSPAFQFYAGDFLSSPDVRMMSTLEKGAYLVLMCCSWLSDHPGCLPNDEDYLRRQAGLTVEDWSTSRDILLRKWPVTDDPAWRYNPRLAKEAANQQERRESASQAGKISAAKRAVQALPATRSVRATPVESPALHESETDNEMASVQQVLDKTATPVAPEGNECSKKGQRKTNTSSSVSSSSPSTLRYEGGAALTAAPARANKKKKSFAQPLLDEVKFFAGEEYPRDAYALEQAAAFLDHFDSNGWLVGGKTPMVDWQASFRNWMRRCPTFQANNNSAGTSGQPAPARAQIAPNQNTNPDRWC